MPYKSCVYTKDTNIIIQESTLNFDLNLILVQFSSHCSLHIFKPPHAMPFNGYFQARINQSGQFETMSD